MKTAAQSLAALLDDAEVLFATLEIARAKHGKGEAIGAELEDAANVSRCVHFAAVEHRLLYGIGGPTPRGTLNASGLEVRGRVLPLSARRGERDDAQHDDDQNPAHDVAHGSPPANKGPELTKKCLHEQTVEDRSLSETDDPERRQDVDRTAKRPNGVYGARS